MNSPSSPAIVVLDNSDLGGQRTLAEIVLGAGFGHTKSESIEDFAEKLKASGATLGVIAYEQLWPDPSKQLEAIRKHVGSRRKLIVVHNDDNRRLKLGQRLWDVGASDHFLARGESPFRFRSILRQEYYDLFIADRLVSYQESLRASDLQYDLRCLVELGPALLGCRSHGAVWRTLSRQVPQILDVAMIMVLVADREGARVHVMPIRPFEHKLFWELEQRICQAAEAFYFRPLKSLEVEYNDSFLHDSNNLPGANASLIYAEPMPMVVNGTLVGCMGIAGFDSKPRCREHLESLIIPLSLHLGPALANIQLLKEVEDNSYTDELTGAYNRRFLRGALTREMKRGRLQGSKFSVAVIDIDHFKKFNDLYGHLEGDAVLREFSAYLSGELRTTDRLVRYGGEEFLILFPDADTGNAALAMERIRTKLLSNPLDSIKRLGSFRFSFSSGIASYPDAGAEITPEQLIKYADAALYEAKQTGRNRICVHKGAEMKIEVASSEKRSSPRIEAQLAAKFSELANFSPQYIDSTTINISAGGVSIRDPEKKLKRNKYLLLFLAGQQDPMLCRVAWTKDLPGGERTVGLEFVRPKVAESAKLAAVQRSKALVISENDQLRDRAARMLQAARLDVDNFNDGTQITADYLKQYSLIIIGESSFRKDIGTKLQTIRESEEISTQIIFINESDNRQEAVKKIQTSKVEHFVDNNESSMETLFAGLNKILMGEIFGIGKYLMWGANSQSWTVTQPGEKEEALSGIHQYAIDVKCHPRIADLLIMAVDEMLINAMRPAPDGRKGSVTVECGSDGRLFLVSVMDELGALKPHDIYRSLGNAIETGQKGLDPTRASANMGFQIMLSTLSQLSVNITPGKSTEVIGVIDLRQGLREYRTAVPSFGVFTDRRKSGGS